MYVWYEVFSSMLLYVLRQNKATWWTRECLIYCHVQCVLFSRQDQKEAF